MVRYAPLIFSAMMSAQASAASMPRELVGEWSPLPAEACGVFTVKSDGYLGTSDGEGYGYKLARIKEQRSNSRSWTAEFWCSGENPNKVKQTSVLNLRKFEGKDLLVVTEQWPKGTEVLVLRRCQQ